MSSAKQLNSMGTLMRFILVTILSIIWVPTYAQTPGFFKDIFVNGGVSLTSMVQFIAADDLGLSIEIMATSDSIFQSEIIVGNTMDTNGHLLYPDGQPRFRMIYVNGGNSRIHGESLGEVGRDRLRSFYYQGGSYMGSCAGAYLACVDWAETGENPAYLHIWPGRNHGTGLYDSYTDHNVPPTSPLLNYRDFGGDRLISNVRHNGGCWGREDIDFPAETEVLLRYVNPGHPMHDMLSTWAYKPGPIEGRIVVTGSHPEFAPSGEIFELTQAMLLYTLDGIGEPQLKAELMNGETRVMDRSFEDDDPAFTRIGDKQYHHFSINVPEEANRLLVELDGESSFDFHLFATPDTFAFETSAAFSSIATGAVQVLEIPVNEAGLWYIGVECATAVSSVHTLYWGQTEVINGASYSITATWDTTTVVGLPEISIWPSEFELFSNYPNPFNPSTTISYSLSEAQLVTLTIYDVSGRQVTQLVSEFQNVGQHEIEWNAHGQFGRDLPGGLYFVRLETVSGVRSIKLSYLK